MGLNIKTVLMIACGLLIACLIACKPVAPKLSTPEIYPRPDREEAYFEQYEAATKLVPTLAQSEHFSLWSEIPDATARLILQDLENLRIALLDYHNISSTLPDMPIDIIMVDNFEYYDAFGIGHSSVGFYSRGLLGPTIIINLSEIEFSPNELWSTLYHEYAHHFHATHLPYKTPLWLNEGLAEYAASFRRTETGYGFGHDDDARINILRTYRGEWLDMRKMVQSLHDYPYIPGYYGEAAAKRTYLYYHQSWLIAMWMQQTEEGAATLERLIQKLDAGEPIEGAFSESFHEDLLSYAQSFSPFQDTHNLPDTSFPDADITIEPLAAGKLPARITLQLLAEGNAADFPNVMSELRRKMAPYNRKTSIGRAITALKYFDFGYFLDAVAELSDANSTPEFYPAIAHLDARLNVHIHNENLLANLSGGHRNAHIIHTNETIQTAISKRPGDIDLDIISVGLLGRNAYNLSPAHTASAQRILESGHHKRNPMQALNLIYPFLSLQEFDEAEAIIARAKLWDTDLTPLESNRFDDVMLDIEARRKAFADRDK